ncbi:hypothetical protein VTL71DRAFT_3224 [Oculimacula yallundae]|uniref:Uncharacterized protein n=1 Tax=Oculimacula yallundae TaxID=86028 RepID=A0ABR4C8F1_9HELO
MVKLVTVREENLRFANENHTGCVCVFAGATSGIGACTLERMITMISSSTFYVIGRSEQRFQVQHAKLQKLNSSNKIVFIQAEFSLIADIDSVSQRIVSVETKVDYLFMSPGLYPLNGAEYSREGLEVCFAVSYYSRIRLISNLLPVLRQSPNPRILSVLSGGREKAMLENDIGLRNSWSSASVINHTTTMTSLTFDHLAKYDTTITFLHSFPGLVKTNIFAAQTAPKSSGLLWKISLALLRMVFAFLMAVLGISPEESGEKQAFILTTKKFGPGVSLVSEKCEESAVPSALLKYHDGGWAEKIWEHTLKVLEQVEVQ